MIISSPGANNTRACAGFDLSKPRRERLGLCRAGTPGLERVDYFFQKKNQSQKYIYSIALIIWILQFFKYRSGLLSPRCSRLFEQVGINPFYALQAGRSRPASGRVFLPDLKIDKPNFPRAPKRFRRWRRFHLSELGREREARERVQERVRVGVRVRE